jgi:hypothetical protein
MIGCDLKNLEVLRYAAQGRHRFRRVLALFLTLDNEYRF